MADSSHPSCFICLNSIDVTAARRPGPGSQFLKQNAASFASLGKVFHVSKVFIDPFLNSARGGERPFQCPECSSSLKELSDVQQTLGSLSEEVVKLQNQLLVKLKQLAKVVGVTKRNKKKIHENLLKTERQLQSLMRGGGFGGLVSPELYSLRQLILGALMMSGSSDNVPEVPENIRSNTSFPNNFVVPDKDSKSRGGLEEFPKCNVKVENVQDTQQNEGNFEGEGEDEWNGYILLNEDEPSQPDDNDDAEFVYADDNEEEEEEIVSEDAGSDYTPSPKRKKVETTNKPKPQGRKRRQGDGDLDSDSENEEKNSEKKSGNSAPATDRRSLTRTLNRMETQLSNHENTLRKLLRNQTLMSRLQGNVENEVKEALASLKCEDVNNGTVDASKFNGLVDQVEKCFSNHAVLRKEVVEMKSSFQGSLDEVANSATNPNSYQIKWPLRCEKDIEVVEKQLEDPAVFQAEVQSLARVGGNKRSKIIYNTLRVIVTHEFAKQIRFTNKTGKIAFGDLKMAALVRDAIKLGNPTKHFTDDHINEKVGAWFRQSVDRGRPSLGKGSANKSKASSCLLKSETSSGGGVGAKNEDDDDSMFQSNLLDL